MHPAHPQGWAENWRAPRALGGGVQPGLQGGLGALAVGEMDLAASQKPDLPHQWGWILMAVHLLDDLLQE